eukprot:CAMPEP_0183309494 /NCGR_PEP_ID=MMETSP0160_2-20130417/25377_1 /TAXON_ID=2839 ORGANISM="Odontella Sinensis, Strain Grunow 1884" /NCGR_SAMPLE_ID=MMETSP0160_2 /ASSEMBLY_ACC=CAM_ASM_000250 /LENGTH=243 /DNA_ID=CAMNT_0025473533 /DNA_START=27 /DNA_END=758 /DNA_ORIENTATION=-
MTQGGGLSLDGGGSDNASLGPKKTSIHSSLTTLEKARALAVAALTRCGHRITLDTLRPLPLFLGVTGPAFCLSPEAFNPPSRHLDKTAPEKVWARVRLNFAFFLTNYALIFFGTAVVVALMHPGMVLYVGMVSGLWWFHSFTMANDIPLVAFGRDLGDILTPERRSMFLTVVSVLVGVYKCLIPVLSVMGISGLIILTHAVLRDPKHIESSKEFGFRGSADSDSEEEDMTDDEMVRVKRGDVV